MQAVGRCLRFFKIKLTPESKLAASSTVAVLFSFVNADLMLSSSARVCTLGGKQKCNLGTFNRCVATRKADKQRIILLVINHWQLLILPPTQETHSASTTSPDLGWGAWSAFSKDAGKCFLIHVASEAKQARSTTHEQQQQRGLRLWLAGSR